MLIRHPTQPGWLISTPEVKRLINAQHRLFLPDGQQVHPLHFTPPDFEADDVIAVRAWAIAEVNRQAGEARTRMGTNIPFQGDVYQLKGAEAAAFAADTEPGAAKYPVLYAEAKARGLEPAALADEYLANAQAWPQIIAAIEAARMSAITAIKAAQDIAAIEAALATQEWPV